ncbi:MAG: hypothetical protein LBI89_02545 [Prevotellaceae bacterium]|nr:hypothetical protein [Prevotellaceae bacterium]
MKITQKNIDDLSATLTLNLEKDDYEPLVKKNLNDYRRKADVKGFRPGMAPMSIIEKKHKGTALYEEVNKLLSQSLSKYIEENNLNLLGEPIHCDNEDKQEDKENPDDFEFVFEIGFAPKVAFTLSETDNVPFYNITITEADKENRKAMLLKQHGQFVNVETVAGEDEYLTVDLVQGEKTINDTSLSLKTIEDKTAKDLFSGKKVGDEWVMDVKKITANEADLAAFLKVKKEAVAGIDPVFTIKIKEIKKFVEAELNQELYDHWFGDDVVKSEAECMQKIEERLRREYENESNYRFTVDAYNILREKSGIKLPETFLKRWLSYSNDQKITPEIIEKAFPAFVDDLCHKIISNYILEEQQMEVKWEDLLEDAKKTAQYHLQMFGVENASEEQIERYANSILANDKEKKKLYEKIKNDKIMDYVKSVVTIDVKEITNDDLQKLYEK